VVRERVVAARATELAIKEGMEKLAAWKADPASALMPAATIVSRDQSQKIPPQVLSAALRADTTALPVFVGVDLGSQGYAVVKVNKVLPRVAPDPATAKQERSQYAQGWSSAENQAYYNYLKESFKVAILAPHPVPASTAQRP
jgi:peptidyl-prolyl cis-trans isomerase D